MSASLLKMEFKAYGLNTNTMETVKRYLDRLISKALVKVPGCYQVRCDGTFVLNAERFFEELTMVYPDLPSELQHVFYQDQEWIVPRNLHHYLNDKWLSFQDAPTSSSEYDSESDEELEFDSIIEHQDELEMLLANDMASKDQVKRLRKQQGHLGRFRTLAAP